jgi:hypothetical protein
MAASAAAKPPRTLARTSPVLIELIRLLSVVPYGAGLKTDEPYPAKPTGALR